MNQIIFIRGGEAFYTKEQYFYYLKKKEYNPYKQKKSWRDWISWALSDNFEVFEPQMPCKQNADYDVWKIWFEKLFPYLGDEKIILIGHSLGGLFLAKYLTENNFPKKIYNLHLVAPLIEDKGLVDEYIGNFLIDKNKIQNLEKQCKKVYLYFSEDDPILPFEQHFIWRKLLKKSKFFIFKNRKHFSQPSFPELLENINKN